MVPFEEIADLPAEWKLIPLGEVVRSQSCDSNLIKGKQSSEPGPGLFPAYSASGQDVWTPRPHHEGDAIIVSAVGARCGKCFRATGQWSAVANTHIIWPDPDQVDPDFLWRIINDETFWVRGQSAQPYVQVSATKHQKIPVPPIPEQRLIAQVLGTVQAAIDQQERLMRTTTELKEALIRELLIRPSTTEESIAARDQINVGSLPSGWHLIPLGDFCDFKGGTQPPKSTFIYEPREGYVRLLQIRDFETDKHACYIQRTKRLTTIDSDDVSIARYGASVGRILTGKTGSINVAIMTMLPEEAKVTKRFLYYILQLEDFQKHITSLGGRSAQAGFNRGEIAPFKFPLPPLKVQKEITTALDALGTKAIHHHAKKTTLQDLFRTLLHELMTGKVRVS